MGAPIEMLGTKCPSMTSTWIRSAPACSASSTCLPKCAKSAARIEGASLITSLSMAALSVGLVKDTLNEFIQRGVELSLGLLSRQPFYEGTRKTRHNAVIPAQAGVGFFPPIPARERDDPQHIEMSDAFTIEVVLLRECELEHDQ